MTKLIVSLLLICSMVFACGQNQTEEPTVATRNEPLSYDTSRIVILPIDTANRWVFKDAAEAQLTNQDIQITNQDIQTVSRLLQECIDIHNAKQDTTKEFSEYIDLKKYKLQYVPFVDKKGHKKVYVNCFCIHDWGFEYWKQALVQVDDGGSCFFHLTINLTGKKYEQLFTNGYG